MMPTILSMNVDSTIFTPTPTSVLLPPSSSSSFLSLLDAAAVPPPPRRSMKPLHIHFVPGPYDVLCARGAHVKQHAGNRLFREKIHESVQAYATANSKLYKSLVVSSIVDFFRSKKSQHAGSGGGGGGGGFFVKQSGNGGTWYDVGEQLSREKVGQALRERLSHQYKSSTKAKRRRWKKELDGAGSAGAGAGAGAGAAGFSASSMKKKQQRPHNDIVFEQIVTSNSSILQRMKALELQRPTFEDSDDGHLMNIFTKNNEQLLKTFQKDTRIRSFVLERVDGKQEKV